MLFFMVIVIVIVIVIVMAVVAVVKDSRCMLEERRRREVCLFVSVLLIHYIDSMNIAFQTMYSRLVHSYQKQADSSMPIDFPAQLCRLFFFSYV